MLGTNHCNYFVIPKNYSLYYCASDFTESPIESSIACSIIAHYCTCCGDTFASEIGTV